MPAYTDSRGVTWPDVPTFTDSNGRVWCSLVRHVADAIEIHRYSGVDILHLSTGEEAARIRERGPAAIIDMIYSCSAPLDGSPKPSGEEFAYAMGDVAVIEEATTAMLEAVARFFGERRARLVMTALSRQREAAEREMASAEEEYRLSNGQRGRSEGPSESTREDSP